MKLREQQFELPLEAVRAKQFDGCSVRNFVDLEKLKRLVPDNRVPEP